MNPYKKISGLNFLLVAVFVIGFSGCASFNKAVINPQPLTRNNLAALNGTYHILNKNVDSVSRKHWRYNNFFVELDRKLLADTLKVDSTKKYAFELRVLNAKQLQIRYIENNRIIRTRLLKTRLKSDGYLYLKNKDVGFWLVPYLAGAIDVKHTRITAAPDGTLIFDVANHRSGAFFFIMFLDGVTWRYRNEYQRY